MSQQKNYCFIPKLKPTQQGIYQAIEEYIRYKQRQELLALRGTIDIEANWQQLRELEKPT